MGAFYKRMVRKKLKKLSRQLEQIQNVLVTILEEEIKMAPVLDRITVEVEETRTVMDSAIVLIVGLADQIRELKLDPVALEALADSLDSKQAELAAAIVANTPEEPPVEPEEPPV